MFEVTLYKLIVSNDYNIQLCFIKQGINLVIIVFTHEPNYTLTLRKTNTLAI